MLYCKTNPTGIDVPIQKAQKSLYSRLKSKWGDELSAYGRAYINNSRGGKIPEVFVDNTEYEDVLGTDDSRFFFVQDNSAQRYDNNLYETDISIYFLINLKDMRGDVDHRADEEVHHDVDYVLNHTDLTINSIETGIENVLSDFDLKDSDNFNFADFEPYHVFKVECTVQYNLQTTKCNV